MTTSTFRIATCGLLMSFVGCSSSDKTPSPVVERADSQPPTSCTPSTDVAHTYQVTTPKGAFYYEFDGDSTQNPTITLVRGKTYVFALSISAIHPFGITTAKTLEPSPPLYSDGVTNNEATSGTVTFSVPCDAPSTLYYECVAHGFGNAITIVDP